MKVPAPPGRLQAASLTASKCGQDVGPRASTTLLQSAGVDTTEMLTKPRADVEWSRVPSGSLLKVPSSLQPLVLGVGQQKAKGVWRDQRTRMVTMKSVRRKMSSHPSDQGQPTMAESGPCHGFVNKVLLGHSPHICLFL
jgi:hypothetical protein